MIALVFLFLILFIGSIIGIVFQAQVCLLFTLFIFLTFQMQWCITLVNIINTMLCFQIGKSVQNTMAKTLREEYAVDLYNWYNRRITEAWDKAQSRVGTQTSKVSIDFSTIECCSPRDFLKYIVLVMFTFYSFSS